jgi:hypothetical protein
MSTIKDVKVQPLWKKWATNSYYYEVELVDFGFNNMFA